jgi:hypothetical protein
MRKGGAMRLKVQTVGDGQHPSEAVVAFRTADGSQEELIVDRRSIKNDSLRVGYPVGRREKDQLLIELPRETLRGTSRVWVTADALSEEKAA